MRSHFDLVVVGAGPGGIAAAVTAAEAGLEVCLVDNNEAAGGQIWRGLQPATARRYPHGGSFLHWIDRLHRSGCGVLAGRSVIDRSGNGLLLVEDDRRARGIRFRRLILATGARERFLPFPGWTLPGVAGAGGLQALVKAGLGIRGQRVVVAGSGPLLLAVAAGLGRAGAHVLGVYEQASLARVAGLATTLLGRPGKLAEGIGYRLRTPYRTGRYVVCAEGADRVERVTITDGARERTIACDWLASGFHLVPNLELPLLCGCAVRDGYVAVDRLQESSVEGVACVGELTGIGGLEKALLEGRIAGLAAAGRASEAEALAGALGPYREFARRLDRAFALRAELRPLATEETIVCRCEDVSRAALSECSSWRQAKLHTRCGMGACQGRVCGAAAEFLFGWEVGGPRPPVYPAAVSALAREAAAIESAHRIGG